MSGINPIESLIEESPLVNPALTPTAPSRLPGIATPKPLPYQATDDAVENLIQRETSEPANELPKKISSADADALIANKPSSLISNGSLLTSTPKKDSNSNTEKKVDPLTGDTATATSQELLPSKTVPADTSTADSLTNPSSSIRTSANPIVPVTAASNKNEEPTKSIPNNFTDQNVNFDINAFKVEQTGKVSIEYKYDGGWYQGQLAIVSLKGMDKFVPGSEAFTKEAARRALSNSPSGYIAINDNSEGAYYSNPAGENFNSGAYLGTKTFDMIPGDDFCFLLVPNGTVQQVYDNPAIGGDKRPLFSIFTTNPNDGFNIGQIADITGEGKLFVMEDMGVSQGSDRDYNDIIFKITGATSKIAPLSQFINSEQKSSHEELAKKLMGADIKAEPKTDSVIVTKPKESPTTDSVIANPPKAETKTDSVIDTKPKAEPKTDSVIDTKPKAEPKTDSVIDTKPKAEPKTDSVIETEPKESPTTDSVIDTKPKESPTTDSVIANPPKAETKADSVIDTKPKAEPKTDSVIANPPKAETKTDSVIDTKPKAKPKTDSVITNPPKAEPKTDSVIDTKPKAEPKTDSVIAESNKQSSPKIEPIGTGTVQPKTESTIDSDTSKLPKTELTPDIKVQKPQTALIVDNSDSKQPPQTESLPSTIGQSDSSTTQITAPTIVSGSTEKTIQKTEPTPESPIVVGAGTAETIIPSGDKIEPASDKPSEKPVIVPTMNSEQEPSVVAAKPLTVSTNFNREIDTAKTKPTAGTPTVAETTEVPTAITAAGTGETPMTAADNQQIKQPVDTDFFVSKPAISELSQAETFAVSTIEQQTTETDTNVTDTNPQQILEALPVITEIAEIPVTLTDLDVTVFSEKLLQETGLNLLMVAEQSPQEIDSLVPSLVEQTLDKTDAIFPALVEELPSKNSVLPAANATEQLSKVTGSNAAAETAELATESTLLLPPKSTGIDTNLLLLPKSTDTETNLLLLETEKPVQLPKNQADNQPVTTQPIANLRSNPNLGTNSSIAAVANSQTPGTFRVGETGEIKFDYLYDGGAYQGELGIFSLTGMEAFAPGTPEFIAEALRRVLTNTTLGRTVISDSTESAKFSGAMPGDGDWGSGEYQNIKTFNMTPGDTFAVMLMPNSSVQQAYDDLLLGAIFPESRPLFSIAPANQDDTAYMLSLANITGTGNTFAIEDMSPPNSDRDYNDLIFKISGATGSAPNLDTLINPDREWRNTTLGQQLLNDVNNSNSHNNPPVVSPTNARTYTELETTISLDNLATDAEGDPITISVLNPVNGTVLFNPLTNKASFKPATGFSGIASFDFLARDAFGSSSPARVTVNVSDVPLLNLDFVKRNPRLNAGENTELIVLGDFADQKGVVLPDSYLTYTSFNPEVAAIDAAGKVTGLVNGTSILSASRNNLQAVTAVRVGKLPAPTNDAEFNAALAEIYGLNVYPKAVTMTAGMARELKVSIQNIIQSIDLKLGSTGTSYFVGNSNLLQVSSDGKITAIDKGITNVTVIHGATEQVVPIRVEMPVATGATLGVNGGAVQASDGSIIMVPPGALTENTPISLIPLNRNNLSLQFPDGLEFAGAFNLDLGDSNLKMPAQLAIPAPAGLSPGTEVLFLRKGSLPDANNIQNPTWLIAESGVVDANGTIRTNSPPFSGILEEGEYAMLAWPALGLIDNRAVTIQRLLELGSKATGPLNLGLQNGFLAANVGLIGIAAVTGAQFAATILLLGYLAKYLQSGLKIIGIPQVGLPVVTPAGVELDPEGIPSVTATLNIPTLFPADPFAPPVLQSAEFKLENGDPTVVLTGSNFLNNSNDLGGDFKDLTVSFRVGDKTYPGILMPDKNTDLGDNRYRIAVKIPITVPVGESSIVVSRKQKKRFGLGTGDYEIVELESEENIRLAPNCVELALVTERTGDKINVINLKDALSTVKTQSSDKLAVAINIPVGNPNNPSDRPEMIAATSNATRAYVTLRGSGRVSVVDLMALREIDTTPETATVDAISLPSGATPTAIAIDPKDNYAYIADQNRPNIYVLDINPNSTTYHQIVQTIAIDSPSGLLQFAINSDGRKLFVTASDSNLHVVNIDPLDKPTNLASNSRKWHQQIGKILTPNGAMGITATSDPSKITFTSGNPTTDGSGFGVLEIANSDPLSFAATARYANLSLGDNSDYFDVNEGVAVTVTKDGRYAFVAGRNSRGNNNPLDSRQGGNIGIIKDPLGPNPLLVAATRPIPGSLTNNVALSSDDKYLTASYPTLGLGGSAYVFDVEEMIKAIENPGNYQLDGRDRGVGSVGFSALTQRNTTPADLARVPIDDINPLVSIAADYEITGGNWINNFTFSVPEGTKRAPIGIGGNPRGLAVASSRNWLKLIDPNGSSKNDSKPLTPTFNWDIKGQGEECGLPGFNPDTDVKEVNLYVSVFPQGKGLLPTDKWPGLENLPLGQDYNPNRVLTAQWKNGTWTWNGSSKAGSSEEFTLSNDRMLTAGQEYHWAVEAVTNKGQRKVVTDKFKTLLPTPMDDGNTFSSVTVLTRGLEPQPNLVDRHLEQMASHMTQQNGLVMYYEADTGRWYWQGQNGKDYQIPANKIGQPLVLIPDLTMTPYETGFNSGFAEAAADSLFGSLVSLNQELNQQRGSDILFNSPTHFIGVGQGAVINSEIIQRLGTFFPKNPQRPDEPNNRKFPDLQMTTIDPHDFYQPSLKGNLRSVKEPQVTVWNNVTFADNYYQEVAAGTGGRTETRNGREIENADRNVSLTARAGLAPDDLFGSPHRQALAWYAGSADLNASKLPLSESKSPTEKIYRRLGDLEAADRTPNSNKTWYSPDYKGYPYTHGSQNAPWEGIGTGWFHSVLGGGQQRRPDALLGVRTPVSFDNTAEARMRGDFAVPTLFNGNFDAVTYRFSQQNVPGWSNYNGGKNVSQGSLFNWTDIPSLSQPFQIGWEQQPTQANPDGVPIFGTYLGQLGIAPGDPNYKNYALRLTPDQEVLHNRFVVPDWGVLRFDLHVPQPNGGTLDVWIKGEEPGAVWQRLSTYSSNSTTRSAEELFGVDLQQGEAINQIGFARYKRRFDDGSRIDRTFERQGFETFNLDIPDSLRGKVATLKFSLQGNTNEVYLDNIFFKSQHLKLGNPGLLLAEPIVEGDPELRQEARVDPLNQPQNYLIERPQYSLSYNNDKKIPNWVSWQLNQTNLGPTSRYDGNFRRDYTLPTILGNQPLHGTYLNSRYDKGHMVASSHRTSSVKDNQETFLLTNTLPQLVDNNRFFSGTDASAWYKLEAESRTMLTNLGWELYNIAGGIGNNWVPQRASRATNAYTNDFTDPTNLQAQGVHIPEWTWKIILALEPGQGIADVTVNTPVIAVMTPNRAEPPQFYAPLGDPAQQVEHPLYSDRLINRNDWRSWRTWQVSVDRIEQETGFDFFSTLPDEVENILEADVTNFPDIG